MVVVGDNNRILLFNSPAASLSSPETRDILGSSISTLLLGLSYMSPTLHSAAYYHFIIFIILCRWHAHANRLLRHLRQRQQLRYYHNAELTTNKVAALYFFKDECISCHPHNAWRIHFLDNLSSSSQARKAFANIRQSTAWVMQDVCTRWWSMWKLIQQLRVLRHDFGVPTNDGALDHETNFTEWDILDTGGKRRSAGAIYEGLKLCHTIMRCLCHQYNREGCTKND